MQELAQSGYWSMSMSEKDDLIIIAGMAVVAWWLLNHLPSFSGTSTNTAAATPIDTTPSGCQSCGVKPQPSAAPENGLSQPNIGSWQNDATLQQLSAMIDQANAAGNWDLSWQIAAKRDAWIKSQGY